MSLVEISVLLFHNFVRFRSGFVHYHSTISISQDLLVLLLFVIVYLTSAQAAVSMPCHSSELTKQGISLNSLLSFVHCLLYSVTEYLKSLAILIKM